MNKRRLWNMALCLVIAMWLSMGVSKLICGWSSIFSFRIFYVMSESMEPVIRKNQFVIGRLAVEGELTVGEIYAYRRWGLLGNEMVIHRLIEVTPEGAYIFQGDNNSVPDEAVERAQIGYHILGGN